MTTPLLSLFHKDFKSQVKTLETALIELKKGKGSPSIWISLEAAFRSVQGAARLVGFTPVSTLAKTLEVFVAGLQTRPQEWTPEVFQALSDVKDLFQSMAEADVSLLPQKVEEGRDLFEKAAVPFKKGPTEKPKEVVPVEKGAEEVVFDRTMMELFRTEVETLVTVLNNGIVELEAGGGTPELFESLMRAAHSIKGAARVVRLEPVVQLAHAIEDCFVAAQKQQLILQPLHIDAILAGIDLIGQLSHLSDDELQTWLETQQDAIFQAARQIASLVRPDAPLAVEPAQKPPPKSVEALPAKKTAATSDRILRVSAHNLNRLMGLAGESLVESRWLQPFSTSLLTVKKRINELSHLLDLLRETLDPKAQNDSLQHYLTEVYHKVNECSQSLTDRVTELDLFIIRHSSLSDRLYREVVDSRMRPFSDGIAAFPRMVRDLARDLGKKVRLEILGHSTPVDRDILEKLDAPLSHLLRNAVDHGIEMPEERLRLGKPAEGTITLEAQHRAGMLAITISDDGGGLDIEALRKKIVEKNLVQSSVAERLTQPEVLEFLFLPGFSTAKSLTEISGRGVGLNVVQSMIQEVSGSVRIQFQQGKGMSFHLQLPLTLSVIRALLVDISGEPYAFPLAHIDRALEISREDIEQIESRQYFTFEGQNIGLVPAAQVLEVQEQQISKSTLPLIVLSDRMNCYGIVVDQFLGERELVLQELDPRLGKVADINSGALTEDGSPILVVDVEDMVRSIDTILSGGRLHKLHYGEKTAESRRKRILVVDDSITVREVECRLLQNRGYDVQTAINGMDGWNAVRMGDFDLVITDVDMPRMNGIELIRQIRADPRLKNLPVMIVSYKERDEDRRLGLEVGANYYLTKSSFHDETLINAVVDLIGAV